MSTYERPRRAANRTREQLKGYFVWSKALTHRTDHTTTRHKKLRLAPRDLLVALSTPSYEVGVLLK